MNIGKVVQVITDVKDGIVGAVGTRFPSGLTIGGSGSDNVEVRAGTCTLVVSASRLPVNGSSTVPASCAATGVVDGDAVFVTIGNDGLRAINDKEFFHVANAEASSTAGFITVQLVNYGAASSSFSVATTSASFLFFDTTR